MAAQLSRVKVISQSQVSPPPGSVSTTKIPLTFFDMAWLFCRPMQRIFFYESPYPTLHFTETVIPRLIESLSLTLRHFYPFAAKLTCPPPPHHPYIVYHDGDAVQFTVAESTADFNHLVANHIGREVKTLHSLFPELPSTRLSSDTTTIVVPVMSIQFTVFPNSGISIGLMFNHMVADGRSFNHFMKFWASVHRSKEEGSTSLPLPYHNKDIVKDPNGLSSIFLEDSRNWENNITVPVGVDPPDNILVTFLITRDRIEQLKHVVTTEIKNIEEGLAAEIRITTFVVTCAFMWVNLVKLQEKIGSGGLDDHDDDDMLYYFVSAADCRERFEFSIPGTYFGNCLAYYFVSAKRRELTGENGIVVAAKAIAGKICELGKGVLVGAETWVSDLEKIVKDGRIVSVAGSPKFPVYETDFGWGRPKKTEIVHIGAYGSFSINESREEAGGVQIGVIVQRDKLDLFNAIFRP